MNERLKLQAYAGCPDCISMTEQETNRSICTKVNWPQHGILQSARVEFRSILVFWYVNMHIHL